MKVFLGGCSRPERAPAILLLLSESGIILSKMTEICWFLVQANHGIVANSFRVFYRVFAPFHHREPKRPCHLPLSLQPLSGIGRKKLSVAGRSTVLLYENASAPDEAHPFPLPLKIRTRLEQRRLFRHTNKNLITLANEV